MPHQKSLQDLGYGSTANTTAPETTNSATPSTDNLKRKQVDRDSPLTDSAAIFSKETRLDIPPLDISLEMPDESSEISSVIQETIVRTIEAAMKPFMELLRHQSRLITKYMDKIAEKDNEIKALQETIALLKSDKDKLEKDVDHKFDEYEQYGRRNAVRIRKVAFDDIPSVTLFNGKVVKDTDSYVRSLCADKLKVDIPQEGISRSHLTGKPQDGKCTIIVKFGTYNLRARVFSAKRKLKGSSILITEDLTRNRQKIVGALLAARKQGKINSVWTTDGRIYFKKDATPTARPVLVDIGSALTRGVDFLFGD